MDRARDPGKGIWKGLQRCASSAVVLLGAVAMGCTVKSPQVPSTDLLISIPVANDSTTIQEVVEDRSEFLLIDDDGRMSINFTTDFGPQGFQEVGNRLQVTPTSNSFSTPIGDITIPGQSIPTISVNIGDLLPLPDDIPAVAIPIPGTDIATDVGVALVGVERLVIRSGGIEIDVVNNLPVPLEDLVLVLAAEPQDVLANIGTVAVGDSSDGFFDLAGSTITGQLAIGVVASTPDASAIVTGDEKLEIKATLQPLIVEEARAQLPEQNFSDSQVLAFPDDRIQVTRAVITEGGLTLNVRNDIPVIIEVELSLDDLTKPNGEVNTFLVDDLIPGAVRTVNFDLTNNEFAPSNPLELRLSYSARTDSTNEPVTIASNGEILVEAVTQNLVFSRVEGTLNQLSLPIPEQSTSVDFPEGLDNIALGSTALEVFVTSGVGFVSKVDLDIRGVNSAGVEGQLPINVDIERGDPNAPLSFSIRPDPGELTDFLNLLPTQVTVEPTVLVGDGVGTEVIEPTHFVQVDSVVFESAARFRIKEDTRIEATPIFREIQDDEARGRIESNLKSATAFTTITNHTPLGVSVSLRVAPDSTGLYSDDFINDPARGFLKIPQEGAFDVPAAPAGDDGRVTQSVSNQEEISLTSEEVLVFLREGGVYTGVLVELSGTEADVEVFGTDFVNVVAGTQVVIELNEDLVK